MRSEITIAWEMLINTKWYTRTFFPLLGCTLEQHFNPLSFTLQNWYFLNQMQKLQSFAYAQSKIWELLLVLATFKYSRLSEKLDQLTIEWNSYFSISQHYCVWWRVVLCVFRNRQCCKRLRGYTGCLLNTAAIILVKFFFFLNSCE